MHRRTRTSKLVKVAWIVALCGVAAAPALATGAEPVPQPPTVSVVPRAAVVQVRVAVRDALANAMPARVLRDSIRHVVRDRLRVAREIRLTHHFEIDVDDVWRDVVDGCCPTRDRSGHGATLLARITHGLSATATELAPKIGVLIATGAKLLGRLLVSLQA